MKVTSFCCAADVVTFAAAFIYRGDVDAKRLPARRFHHMPHGHFTAHIITALQKRRWHDVGVELLILR